MRTRSWLSVLLAALFLFFCCSGPCLARQAASEALTSEEVMILLNLLIEKAESAVPADGEIENAALIEKLMKIAEGQEGPAGSPSADYPAAEPETAAPEPQPEDEAIDCVMGPIALNQVYSCTAGGHDAEFAINLVWQPRMYTHIAEYAAVGYFVEMRIEITNLTDKTWDGLKASSFSLIANLNGVESDIIVPLNEQVSIRKSTSYEQNQIRDPFFPGQKLSTFLIFDVAKETNGGTLIFRAEDKAGQQSVLRIRIPLPKFIRPEFQ